jgi:sugar phosphate isomerase/epimerase
MKILFHTIALEPARWTPQRVSRPLVTLLPAIAEAGFTHLEIYEPHLTAAATSEEIKEALSRHNLLPVVLSSYINLNPAETSDAEMEKQAALLSKRIGYYGFKKLRVFPGPKMSPTDPRAIEIFVNRVKLIASALPDTEILLETHDGSLADDPEVLTRIVNDLDDPKVGLLYQPTMFERDASLAQFQIQKSLIRHVHLQNRNADLSFATLRDGVIPWADILRELDDAVDLTLEFVPKGICAPEQFDLTATLQQAIAEVDCVREVAVAGD